MGEETQVFSSGEVTLDAVCPECGDMIPVSVTVALVVCECGLHQTLGVAPDLTDVAAHIWVHEQEES